MFAAWLKRIPIVCHESDLTPGLANRLSFPFVKKICLTFSEAEKRFNNSKKTIVTGTPLRAELFTGNPEQGRTIAGFDSAKPILLFTAGGSGSKKINQVLRNSLSELLKTYQIIHLCGKGEVDNSLKQVGYTQFEYVDKELADLFACADLVISRSGANALYELIALKKPHLLIPLSMQASRGDQIHNANYFAKLNMSRILKEESLSVDSLIKEINRTFENISKLKAALEQYQLPNSTETIYRLCDELKPGLARSA